MKFWIQVYMYTYIYNCVMSKKVEELMKSLSDFGKQPNRLKDKDLESAKITSSGDYRRSIRHFYIDGDGNLVWRKLMTGEDPMSGLGHDYVIEADRLTESDWIAHMYEKMDYVTFGEFVCAYLKALEMKGIKSLNIDIFGFNETQKFVE